MSCKEAASNVTLHAVDLTIENSTVVLREVGGEEPEDIVSYEYDTGREFFVLQLAKPLSTGSKYVLSIDFTAPLRDDLRAFFRSPYKNPETGTEEYIAITQFQITEARRSFPCFDEPGIKAKYEVSLGRTREMASLSNMPAKQVGAAMDGSDEYVWDHFEESVPMSSYLVAFFVGKFKSLESTTAKGVNVRVWAKPGYLDQLIYANEVGGKVLTFFEDYFNIPFPLPKMDMIALPEHQAGAMENWGLITYK